MFTRAVVVIALVLLCAAPGLPLVARAPGAPGRGTADSAAAAPAHEVHPVPAAGGSAQVLRMISLVNGSTWPGLLALPNGVDPVGLAYDAIEDRLFVALAGPPTGLLVVQPDGGGEPAFWPLALNASATPTAVVYDPAVDEVFVADGRADNLSVFDGDSGASLGSVGLGNGSDPVALALDPGSDAIYVAEPSKDVVVPVNASTLAVGAAVSVGGDPTALVYDPLLQKLLVADTGADEVSVVTPGSSGTPGVLPVGSRPDAIAFNPADARVLVANAGSDNVTVLNRTSLASLASYGTGADPDALAVTTVGITIVANRGDGNLTVVVDPNSSEFPSLGAGRSPDAVVWDPTNGRVYVANGGSDNLTACAGNPPTGAGAIPLGVVPGAVTALPGGEGFAVAEANRPGFGEVAATTGTLGPNATTDGTVQGLASDPADGTIYAAVAPFSGVGGNLTAFNASTGAEVGSVAVGPDPTGVAYDPGSGRLFVADLGNGSIAIVDPAGPRVVGWIDVPGWSNGSGPSADQLVDDPTDGLVFASAGTTNASVLVVAAATGAVVATVATPAGPSGLAFDPADDEVYVACTTAGTVTAIAAATQTVLENATGFGDPSAAAYDPADGALFVTVPIDGSIAVLHPNNLSAFGLWPISPRPMTLAFDYASSQLLVADPIQGSVVLVGAPPPTYPVRFVALGLPAGTAGWQVTVDGTGYSSANATIALAVTNGTHSYTVSPVPPLVPTPSAGSFSVLGNATTLAISFGIATYAVTFEPVGLPSGGAWWVNLSGTNRSTSGPSLSFDEPNGSYPYLAGSDDPAYGPRPGFDQGIASVDGFAPSPITVAYVALPPYLVTFTDTGLPSGTNWSVYLGGQEASGRVNLTFRVTNGSYLFTVPSVGTLVPSPSHGTVNVSGGSPGPLEIVFAPAVQARYLVQFLAAGVSINGSVVHVDLNVSSSTSTVPPLGGPPPAPSAFAWFDLINGSYSYSIYLASATPISVGPASGVFVVAGGPVNVTVNFSRAGAGGTSLLAPLGVPWWVWGAGAAAGVLAAVVILALGRRPGRAAPRVVEAELVRSGPSPWDGAEPAPDAPDGTGDEPA